MHRGGCCGGDHASVPPLPPRPRNAALQKAMSLHGPSVSPARALRVPCVSPMLRPRVLRGVLFSGRGGAMLCGCMCMCAYVCMLELQYGGAHMCVQWGLQSLTAEGACVCTHACTCVCIHVHMCVCWSCSMGVHICVCNGGCSPSLLGVHVCACVCCMCMHVRAGAAVSVGWWCGGACVHVCTAGTVGSAGLRVCAHRGGLLTHGGVCTHGGCRPHGMGGVNTWRGAEDLVGCGGTHGGAAGPVGGGGSTRGG